MPRLSSSTPRHRLVLRFALFAVFNFVFALAAVKPASAAILFEGWSKVLISGKHVGYVVQRYDFDEKKKEFRSTHFLKTNADSGGLTESLVARADASFKPIAYQYTNVVSGKPTLIDATFKGDKMTAVVTEGKEKKTIKNTMPKGTFLSVFLGYVMLQGKEGLKKGVKYEYQGVLEESALISKGEAYIAEEETVSGIPVFRILNTINGSKFISLATHKAEILGTVSPSIGVQTVLVATMEEAIAGLPVNNQALTQLFGSMPKGKDNEIARRSLLPAPKTPPVPAASAAAAAAVKPGANAPVAPPVNVTAPIAAPATSPAPATPPSGK
ncbi:hypothetical protein BH10BDE1_BH10BDE1_29710 [soil metagenome]